MSNNGLLCGHKLLGYLLLPFRVLAILPFLVLALISMYLCDLRILPKKIGYSSLKLFASMTISIFGINVHIKKDEQYEKYKMLSKDDKFFIIYNHITPLDSFVLKKILDDYISFVSFDTNIGLFPISCISKFLDVVKVCRTKRTNGTERIQKFLKTN